MSFKELIHRNKKHTTAIKLENLLHNEHFWEILLMVTLVAAFIALAIWAGMSGGIVTPEGPTRPFLPYMP